MGYDASKKVKGRKIHALVDTEGLPLRAMVHSAAIQDRDGAAWSSTRSASASLGSNWSGRKRLQRPPGRSRRRQSRRCISKSSNVVTTSSGFIVLPRRWVVERTFSGSAETAASPRITKISLTLAAFVTLACIQIAVRRLAR